MGYGEKAEEMAGQLTIAAGRQPSIAERLKMQREQLEESLARVKAAEKALAAHPEVHEVLELLAKAGKNCY